MTFLLYANPKVPRQTETNAAASSRTNGNNKTPAETKVVTRRQKDVSLDCWTLTTTTELPISPTRDRTAPQVLFLGVIGIFISRLGCDQHWTLVPTETGRSELLRTSSQIVVFPECGRRQTDSGPHGNAGGDRPGSLSSHNLEEQNKRLDVCRRPKSRTFFWKMKL